MVGKTFLNTRAEHLIKYEGEGDVAYIDVEYGVILCKDGQVRFMWDTDHYRPNLTILLTPDQNLKDQLMAQDILAFVSAYLERPDEFDRSSDDYEQQPQNRVWWENECRL